MDQGADGLDGRLPSRGLVFTRLDVARGVGVAVVTAAAAGLAWIGDDSLITLRTALNLEHGWGPGFNATESVQAYTSPLWFLLWLVLGGLTDEWILAVVVLGLACSVAAVSIMLWHARSLVVVILATGGLLLSNAFMEYTTSGLENPLAFLLAALAVPLTVSVREGQTRAADRSSILLGAVLAGLFLTRFDLALLFAPVGILLVWHLRRAPRALGAALAAFTIPLLMWFGWSWVTYQSLLPNTFLAKRNLEIPIAELLAQGVAYLYVSIGHDPATLVVLLASVCVSVLWGTPVLKAWSLGVVIYVGYVVSFGGDFMAGRFLAVPVFVSVFLLVVSPVARPAVDETHPEPLPRRLAPAVALLAVVAGACLLMWIGRPAVALAQPSDSRWQLGEQAGIADERGHYVAGHGRDVWSTDLTGSSLLAKVRRASRAWPTHDGPRLQIPDGVEVKCGGLGLLGTTSSPRVHVVDECALADRFLAAQPFFASDVKWRIGHFVRDIPDGYLEALATNDPYAVRDEALALQLRELWSSIRR